MSKITNEGLTHSGAGCFTTHMASVGIKGLMIYLGFNPPTDVATEHCSKSRLQNGYNWL